MSLAEARNHAPLFDAPRFVRNLERGSETMIAYHCRGERPSPIDVREEGQSYFWLTGDILKSIMAVTWNIHTEREDRSHSWLSRFWCLPARYFSHGSDQ